MAMEQELEFRVTADDSEFQRAMDGVDRRLEQLANATNRNTAARQRGNDLYAQAAAAHAFSNSLASQARMSHQAAAGTRQLTYGMAALAQGGGNAGRSLSTVGAGLTALITILQPELLPIMLAVEAIITLIGMMVDAFGKGLQMAVDFFRELSQKAMEFGSTAFNEYMKLEAGIVRASTFLGAGFNNLQRFIDANAFSYGMSIRQAYEYSSQYANLIRSAVRETGAQTKLTIDYLTQTAVIASRTGYTYEQVAEKIASGLRGNTRAIDDLGIYVQVSALEMTDAFKRIADGRSWKQLNAYERQQVRILGILEQSTKAYGTTMAETASYRMAQFHAALNSLTAVGGQFLAQAIVPIVMWLTQLAVTAYNAITALSTMLGFQIQIGDNGGLGDAADDADDMAGGLGRAADAAKKLLAFDEVFTLKGSGGGGGGGAGGGYKPPPVTTTPIEGFDWPFLKELEAWFQNSNLKLWIDELGRSWDWFYKNVLIPIKEFAGQAFLKFLAAVDAAFGVLYAIFQAIKPDLKWLWDNILAPLAKYTAQKFLDTMDRIIQDLKDLKDWCEKNPEKVRAGFRIIALAALALASPFIILSLAVLGWIQIGIGFVTWLAFAAGFILSIATGDWAEAFNILMSYYSRFGTVGMICQIILLAIRDTFRDVVKILKALAKGDWKTAWDIFKNDLFNFKDAFDKFPNLVKFLKDMASALKPLTSLLSTLANTLTRISNIKLPVLSGSLGSNYGVKGAASGAVVTRSTLLNVGEGTYDEAIIPLEGSPQMKRFVEEIANAVTGAGRGGATEVRLVVDGYTLAKQLVDPMHTANKNYGRRLIEEVQG
jgi:hypothetical protein